MKTSYTEVNDFILYHRDKSLYSHMVNFLQIASFRYDKPISIYGNSKLISRQGPSLTSSNQLLCYLINKQEEPLWEFSLPEDLTLFGSIHVINNVLYFHAVTWDSRRLHYTYGLDIETGRVLWQIEEGTNAYHFNASDNLVYGFGADTFEVVDPATGQFVIKKDMSEYYHQGIDSNVWQNTVQGDRLWFISGRGESLKFGALDAHSGDIIIVQDYPLPNDTQVDSPIFHNGKLYLRDENNVLHIFE